MPKSLFEVDWVKIGLPRPMREAFDRYCSERTESRSDVIRRCLAREIAYSGPSDQQVSVARSSLAYPYHPDEMFSEKLSEGMDYETSVKYVRWMNEMQGVKKWDPPPRASVETRDEVKP
jgi:metal-responsive CopG/Arc/MetJ family transcriptional regulator